LGFLKRITSLFGSDKVTATRIINLLNSGSSIIATSRDLYNLPEVRTAINFVAEKIGSVPFNHVRADYDGNSQLVNDSVNYVLTVRTNPYQGPQVFFTYAATRLLLANNIFILPDWGDNGQLKALYVLPFTQYEFSQQDGRLVITFPYSQTHSFYYDDIIHLQRFPAQKGGTQKQATDNYVSIVNTLQAQAVKDSENSQRIAALLQVKTPLKGPDMLKKLNEFKDLFLTAENTTGFGMIGGEYDIHDLNLKTSPLNKDVLESIISYLYNYFGVSKEIIANTANELQYEQFIDNTIRPIIYQIEEELTYKLFSYTEIAHYNKVAADMIELEISTLQAKTSFFKEMIFAGVMSRNEIRKRLYMNKGPAILDEYMESKNFTALTAGNYVVEAGGGETNTDGQPAETDTEI